MEWARRLHIAALAVAAVVASVQVWAYYYWLMRSNDRCDFPEECLGTFYPMAFSNLARLWVVSVVLGVMILVGSALRHNARVSVLRLGAAAAAVFLSLFLTPIYQGRDASGHLNGGDPIGDHATYPFGALALGLAAMLCGWELVAQRGARSPIPRLEADPPTAELSN